MHVHFLLFNFYLYSVSFVPHSSLSLNPLISSLALNLSVCSFPLSFLRLLVLSKMDVSIPRADGPVVTLLYRAHTLTPGLLVWSDGPLPGERTPVLQRAANMACAANRLGAHMLPFFFVFFFFVFL